MCIGLTVVNFDSMLMFFNFTSVCSALSTWCVYHSENLFFMNILQLPFTVKSNCWDRCVMLLGTFAKYMLFRVKCKVTSSVIYPRNTSKTRHSELWLCRWFLSIQMCCWGVWNLHLEKMFQETGTVEGFDF